MSTYFDHKNIDISMSTVYGYDMNTLLSLYIACTIFGAGVTLIDMFGVFSDLFQEGDDGSDDGDDASGDEGDGSGDEGDASGDEGGDNGEGDADGDDEGAEEAGEDYGVKGSIISHENSRKRHFLLRILSVARSSVHFSLGFGPVGWFALATGRSTASSLAWSVPVGIVAAIGGRLLRQIQRSELDSQLKTEDLIMERGEVLVSIGQGQMGKVRIHLEGTYAERFARAKNSEETFRVGTKIRVVDVSDECVYVEDE